MITLFVAGAVLVAKIGLLGFTVLPQNNKPMNNKKPADIKII
jgi:hypothetical protein